MKHKKHIPWLTLFLCGSSWFLSYKTTDWEASGEKYRFRDHDRDKKMLMKIVGLKEGLKLDYNEGEVKRATPWPCKPLHSSNGFYQLPFQLMIML